MFREMRKPEQILSKEDTIEILKAGSSGVLGVTGDNGYPYTVPLSFVYQDGRLFFHCATSGNTIDGITKNEKVSFCVIDKDEVVAQAFTTRYRSAIIFGKARILTEDAERRMAMEYLHQKYSPDFMEEGRKAFERAGDKMCLVEIRIEHMTGKAAVELVKGK